MSKCKGPSYSIRLQFKIPNNTEKLNLVTYTQDYELPPLAISR